MFIRRVSQYIEEKHLLQPGDKVLVALSGGADSVALLLVLLQAGFHCEAAHCNFHLRGKESDRDEKFVRDLCRSRSIRLHTKDFDTMAYARKKGISIEMAARELRYGYFEELRTDWRFDKIAVAHHRDDNVETLLLHLVRGTGLKGLTGMRYRNGYVIRWTRAVRKSSGIWPEKGNLTSRTARIWKRKPSVTKSVWSFCRY